MKMLRPELYFFFLLFWSGISFAQNESGSIDFSNIIALTGSESEAELKAKAAHVVPTQRQLNGLENEFIAFIHFGPNTFTGREWGNGMENPRIFNPTGVDAEQWVRTLKEAEIKMVILTVKHHDGYVLWQSRYTDHGIMQSPYKDGQGDILRELADACRKYDMKLGIYLSPADLYQIEAPEGLYGNGSHKEKRIIPREIEGRPFSNNTKFEFELDDYNEYFLNQLFEVLTEYGPVYEVWFDGANPKEKGGQTYDYDAWLEVVNTLAPDAVVFGAGDVRWCGNEAGYTRENEWNVVPFKENPERYTKLGNEKSEDIGSIGNLANGNYLKYVYAETDTSIRDGWFYRDDDKQAVRSADDVYDIWERAVGGNSVLLLNVPPNKDGRFSPRDVEALKETGRRIRETYGKNLLSESSAPDVLLDDDISTGIELTDELIITTPQPVTFNRIVLQEAIGVAGERIERHAVDARIEGEWRELIESGNVGHKRILRFPDVTTDSIRIRLLDKRLNPVLSKVSAHYYPAHPPVLSISRDLEGMVTIEPKRSDFKWKNALNEAAKNLSKGVEIHYTIEATNPVEEWTVYKNPFQLNKKATVKAMAVLKEETGPVAEMEFGYPKKDWDIINAPENKKDEYKKAIDADTSTFCVIGDDGYITLDLGKSLPVSGFIYTPPVKYSGGSLIEKGSVAVSSDGKVWEKAGEFEFGNIQNDPTPRKYIFSQQANSRYIRLKPEPIEGRRPGFVIAEIDIF